MYITSSLWGTLANHVDHDSAIASQSQLKPVANESHSGRNVSVTLALDVMDAFS